MKTASGAQLDFGRLALLVLMLGVGWYFWDSPVFWPLKLLVVMMHESGHALATLLVGGSVDKIHLAANESGSCLSRVPPGFLPQVAVYSGGYLGSAVAGAGLLLATFRFQFRRWVLGAACVWLGVMGVLYAGDGFTLLFCLGTALVMGLGAKYLPGGAVDVLNLFIAAFTALYAVFDLRDDLWNSAVRSRSDAALLAELTWVPAFAWAVLWTLLAVGLLAVAAYWSMHAKPRGGVQLPKVSARARRV
ncbi:M50 family metallopeptidase [Myxococcus sp. RHSTA-1-4]|uniref:M50 family metallopeptidase n=1 Tax=Myxococcus sp. RHSTA-1-4 TaxID=2874601 RepID=UPI001CBCA19C|nr:M50 family metallopeptidase [Myxococcus sp. RHSTA-1-4]MBZ4417129.1 M50 family metallopeptidase [Myxococcus sp. RHSTA-1-4]